MIDHGANSRIAGHDQYPVVSLALFQKTVSDTGLIVARTMAFVKQCCSSNGRSG